MQEQRERMEARRRRLREAAENVAKTKKAVETKKPTPTPAEKKPAKNPTLYKNRAKSLEEHRKLRDARKLLKGGANVGPVANAGAYGEQLKKPKGRNIGPVKSGAEYARSLTKGKSAGGSKPVNKVPQPFADGAKGGKYDQAVENKEKAKSNFFRSSSGTRGEPLPSNPKLKSQDTSHLTGRQQIALEVAKYDGPKSSHKRAASRKPTNPKKGTTYVTRTGMTMVWTGKNWKQKTK